MNNPFRAAQNPQATSPQTAPALADAVAVAVVDGAKPSRRAPVKTHPLLTPKTPPLPRPSSPPPRQQQPRPKASQPIQHNNPRAQNAPNVRPGPNAPRANPIPAPPSRRVALWSRVRRWSNAFSV